MQSSVVPEPSNEHPKAIQQPNPEPILITGVDTEVVKEVSPNELYSLSAIYMIAAHALKPTCLQSVHVKYGRKMLSPRMVYLWWDSFVLPSLTKSRILEAYFIMRTVMAIRQSGKMKLTKKRERWMEIST